MNVTAVFALKKVYERPGFGAFNSVLKLKFAGPKADIGLISV